MSACAPACWPICAGAGSSTCGTPKPTTQHLPEIEQRRRRTARAPPAHRTPRRAERGEPSQRAPGDERRCRATNSQSPAAPMPNAGSASTRQQRRDGAEHAAPTSVSGPRQARARRGSAAAQRSRQRASAAASARLEDQQRRRPPSRPSGSTSPSSIERGGDARRSALHGCAPMRRERPAARRAPTQRHERHAEQRRHDQRRPDLHGLAVVRAAQQPRAQPGLRAGRQLADDGADQAGRDRHFQRWRTGTASRPASAASRTPARGVAL